MLRAAALLALVLFGAMPAQAQPRAQAGGVVTDAPQEGGPAAALRPEVVAVLERPARVLPADLKQDPEVRAFFERFIKPAPTVPRYLGSGVVTSADGLILTTSDVMSEPVVRFTDGRELPARKLGFDSRTQLTLLKVDATGLPAARMGDVARIKTGDPVTAMAYRSRDTDRWVAAGRVRERESTMNSSQVALYIETDVGNMDGPVFNAAGELIGINAYYYSKEPERAFAIPVTLALQVQEQLRQHGRVIRGRLGFTQQQLTAAQAGSFGLPGPAGALVTEVEAGGPAQRAGVLPNDVVLEIDGKPVRHPNEAAAIVAALRPGTPAAIVVWRQGARRTMNAVVGEQVSR